MDLSKQYQSKLNIVYDPRVKRKTSRLTDSKKENLMGIYIAYHLALLEDLPFLKPCTIMIVSSLHYNDTMAIQKIFQFFVER